MGQCVYCGNSLDGVSQTCPKCGSHQLTPGQMNSVELVDVEKQRRREAQTDIVVGCLAAGFSLLGKFIEAIFRALGGQ